MVIVVVVVVVVVVAAAAAAAVAILVIVIFIILTTIASISRTDDTTRIRPVITANYNDNKHRCATHNIYEIGTSEVSLWG